MIYTTQDMSDNIELERLSEEENEQYIQLIPIVESTHYGVNIINIENLLSFAENSILDFDEILDEVLYTNKLNINEIAFSVKPSSVYLDENVQYICSVIKENNIPLLLKNDDNSYENLLLNSLCLECEELESDEPLSILEGELSNIGHDFGRRVVVGTARSVKKGVESGLAKSIDRNTFGRLLDTRDSSTNKITRNGRLTNIFGHGDNIFKDISDDVLDNIRKDASQTGVEAIKYKLIPMLNAVKKKLGYYQEKEKQYSAVHPQMVHQKRSFFSRILNKLRALRDKILAILRGGRR